MRDLIHKLLRPLVAALLLLTAASVLVSCANTADRQAANQQKLVKDPDAKKEGELPWNHQEAWETQGSNLSGITDRR